MVGGGFVNSQHVILLVDFRGDGFAGKQPIRTEVIAINRDAHSRRGNDWLAVKFHRVIQMAAILNRDDNFPVGTFERQLGSVKRRARQQTNCW